MRKKPNNHRALGTALEHALPSYAALKREQRFTYSQVPGGLMSTLSLDFFDCDRDLSWQNLTAIINRTVRKHDLHVVQESPTVLLPNGLHMGRVLSESHYLVRTDGRDAYIDIATCHPPAYPPTMLETLCELYRPAQGNAQVHIQPGFDVRGSASFDFSGRYFEVQSYRPETQRGLLVKFDPLQDDQPDLFNKRVVNQ